MGGRTISKYDDPKWLGQKFGMLTVTGFVNRKKGNKYSWCWQVKCECGEERIVYPYKLINGNTKSCGCAKKDRCRNMTEKYRITHNGRNDRLYHIWRGMKQRCLNVSGKDYKNYGGRGISVCEEWANDYAAFKKWALENGYSDELSIDRINVDADYSPENCRWADAKTQMNNTRFNIFVEINGETKTVKQWCDYYKLNPQTIYSRIHRGISPYDSIMKSPELYQI